MRRRPFERPPANHSPPAQSRRQQRGDVQQGDHPLPEAICRPRRSSPITKGALSPATTATIFSLTTLVRDHAASCNSATLGPALAQASARLSPVRPSATPPLDLVLVDPVLRGLLVLRQVTGHLKRRLVRLQHDPDGSFTKLPIEATSLLWHSTDAPRNHRCGHHSAAHAIAFVLHPRVRVERPQSDLWAPRPS